MLVLYGHCPNTFKPPGALYCNMLGLILSLVQLDSPTELVCNLAKIAFADFETWVLKLWFAASGKFQILRIVTDFLFSDDLQAELFDTWSFNLYGRGTGGISPKLSDTVRPTPCHIDTHQKTVSHVGYLSSMLIWCHKLSLPFKAFHTVLIIARLDKNWLQWSR